jgi:hypothetical protein
VGSVGAVGAACTVTVAALLAVGLAAVAALGVAGDRPGAGAGLGGVAFAVQLHHHPRTEGRVVLGPPDPLGRLLTRPGPDREFAVVERHKHRVQARGCRPAAALASRLNHQLPDGLRVRSGHPKAVAGEGFAQRRPGGPKPGRGRVHRTESFGELEGAFGLSAVGKEPAWLPAQRT